MNFTIALENVGLRLPRHSNSDHRAIVAEFYAGHQKKMKVYRRKRQRFPIRLPKYGPRTEMEASFEELQSNCVKPPPRALKSNSWISDATWQLVDRRAQLRRRGMLSQAGTRKLGREIKASLKSDRKTRAATAASTIEGHLDAGGLKEAWRCLKGWYANATDKAAKPCYKSVQSKRRRGRNYIRRYPHRGTQFQLMLIPSTYRRCSTGGWSTEGSSCWNVHWQSRR
mmetsp:Transcript_7501/g.17019  ORF Transcript_7501/g.17019 Transcript_7501/m.17019 type:complete len:226 (-) Transcript_7501:948-1625(-)